MESSQGYSLKILIVEDNFSFGLKLQMLIEQLGYQSMGIIDNGEEALTAINNDTPDVILMDIELKGVMTGVELGEKIQSKQIPILFITSFQDEETYERAKKLKLVGFLVKPMNEFTLTTALDVCLKNIPSSTSDKNIKVINESLLIKKGKSYNKIRINEISYIESDKEYIIIHVGKGKFVIQGSLKKMLDILTSYSFARCHQSYLVNLQIIQKIDTADSVIITKDGTQIPAGRRFRKEIENIWQNMSIL